MLQADKSDILHRGCFDALIFVLDVKASGIDIHRNDEIVDTVDWQRLEEHVQQWSDYVLSLLFDIMSGKLKLCLVFINKCNLVRELSGSDKHRLKNRILDSVSPFNRRLHPRTRGVLMEVVQGSARDVEDVAGIRKLIETTALNRSS
jgi:hypothetical protein